MTECAKTTLMLFAVLLAALPAGAKVPAGYVPDVVHFSGREELGETLAEPIIIATLPYADTGYTCDRRHDYDETCEVPWASPGAPDVVYAFAADVGRTITVSLCAGVTDYDTKLYMYEDELTPGAPYACNDDACTAPAFPWPYVSRFTTALRAGHTYYIVIDGYSAIDCGYYSLAVEGWAACCNTQSGACQLLTVEDCVLSGGQWLPDAASCLPNPCPDVGVCCTGEICQITTSEAECAGLGGDFYADKESCSPNPCTWGVCCLGNGGCVLVREEGECSALGGEWRPDLGERCDPMPCSVRVEADGSGDFPTIQAAIDAVVDGGTVSLGDGIYSGSGNRNLTYRGKAITVRSRTGDPAACGIDCGGEYAIRFDDGEDSLSIVDGIRICNGSQAVRCDAGTSPTFRHCEFLANVNRQSDGGAVYCEAGSAPRFWQCRFATNAAEHRSGGAIAVEGGGLPLELDDCVFEANASAGQGGAICSMSSGAVHITRCTFATNAAEGGGGAVYCRALDAYGCAFTANQGGDAHGGAIACNAGGVALVACAFEGNSGRDGGALWCDGALAATACAFASNSATLEEGGAISRSGGAGTVTLVDCDFVANHTTGTDSYSDGGAVAVSAPGISVTLTGCQFQSNSSGTSDAAQGGAVCCQGVGEALFTECEFSENNGWGDGGAIYCGGVVSVSISGSAFVGNTCEGGGGGMAADACDQVRLAVCQFVGNSVTGGGSRQKGGALYCKQGGTVVLLSCIFAQNHDGQEGQHGEGGGAAYCQQCPVRIEQSTFWGNSSSEAGSAAYIRDAEGFELVNCIVASGVGPGSGGAVECDYSHTTVTCCDVYGNADGDWVGCLQGMLGLSGNVSLDPRFCDAENGNLALDAESPCAPGQSGTCELIGALPVGCGLSSVCCVGEQCQLLPAEECAGLGGVFHPEWSSCEAPNPCGLPHVCCKAGVCYLVLEGDCSGMEGEWHLEWSSCDGNPCAPQGVEAWSAGSAPLLKIMPSPSVGAVRMTCALGAESSGRLEILDGTGRVVRHLPCGVAVGGLATVEWDGRDDAGRRVAHGTYFCRLSAGSDVTTERLIRIE